MIWEAPCSQDSNKVKIQDQWWWLRKKEWNTLFLLMKVSFITAWREFQVHIQSFLSTAAELYSHKLRDADQGSCWVQTIGHLMIFLYIYMLFVVVAFMITITASKDYSIFCVNTNIHILDSEYNYMKRNSSMQYIIRLIWQFI